MRTFLKFLLFLLIVAVIIGVLFRISRPHFSSEESPERILSYSEAVPSGFSAPDLERVLDPRDAGPLLQPRLRVARVTDTIVEAACPRATQQCKAQAIYDWVRRNIEYREVMPHRAHVISPEETLLYREGDATTISILLVSMLRSQGMDGRVAVTPYASYVEATRGSETFYLDPACGSCRLGSVEPRGTPLYWIS